MKIKYLATVLIGLAALSLTQRADAILGMTYQDGANNSSQYLLGTVIAGLQGNGGQANRDALMTNQLLSMGLGVSANATINGTTSLYSRSYNNFGSLPAATATGAVTGTGILDGTSPVTVDLGIGYTYLVVSYDGPNGSVAVFNVSGLTGTVDLYRYAAREVVNGNVTGNLLGSNVAQQGYFRMTGWTLLNPTPDGGMTAMLLGAALGALTMTRRFLKI